MQTERPIIQRRDASPAVAPGLNEIDPLLARIYAMRDVSDSQQLDYGLGRLAPVGSLDNIDAAVELLIGKREQRIVVVGDFDVDGATSTAIMLRCLRAFGFPDVGYLVPNRFDYGYGLTPEIVRVAATDSPALIVTVDNGISSADGVLEAREAGISVLVTDHHLPGSELHRFEKGQRLFDGHPGHLHDGTVVDLD